MAKRQSANLDDDDDVSDSRSARGLDPLVKALLGHLPKTHSVWPPQERQNWIKLLSDVLSVVYKDAPEKGATGGSTQHPGGTLPTSR